MSLEPTMQQQLDGARAQAEHWESLYKALLNSIKSRPQEDGPSPELRHEAEYITKGLEPDLSNEGYYIACAEKLARAVLATPKPPGAAAPGSQEGHTDDQAVDRFAAVMKAKLKKKREDGRSGWDDPARCSIDHLADLLLGHLPKGDVVDVANFCMMLHERGATREEILGAFTRAWATWTGAKA